MHSHEPFAAMMHISSIPQRSHARTRKSSMWRQLVILSGLLPSVAQSALIDFDNCLNPSILESKPLQLQFQPLFVDAKFSSDSNRTLDVIVYGNVAGQAFQSPPNNNISDPANGYMIENITGNITTFFSTFNMLTYVAYNAPPSPFCNSVISRDGVGADGGCPLPPLFNINLSNPNQLHAFKVSHDFGSSYSLATLEASLKVQSGRSNGQFLACIDASITPDLGKTVSQALRWVPAAILALVAVATLAAAKYGPSSSKNFFYWSSYYGRNEDLLRLVTPGFADCLQYIQFVVLTGALSLNYPGFYQPVVSKAAWSTLSFNESFVTNGPSYPSLVDGIYTVNGSYGLSNLGQIVGMSTDSDIWACTMIWTAVIVAIVVVVCEIGFAIEFCIRHARDAQSHDLRSKNFPFTMGVIIRIFFTFFILPIVSLSMFQLVIAARSPASVVAPAVILLVLLMISASWIFYKIYSTTPRTTLFDNLHSLMLYGPLYNTFSEDTAPFAMVPTLLNFVRGIAIGAIQPAGVAQLVILAICEIGFVLAIHAVRPFDQGTSMNAYHTFFSVIRLITVLLSVAFVPSLAVSEGIRGWIGYAILLLHAIVLVFGFFLNAVQTLIEVCGRRDWSDGSTRRRGFMRVFGVRQLSKRTVPNRMGPLAGGSDSLGSSAVMLDAEFKARHPHRLTNFSGASSNNRHFSFDERASALGSTFAGGEDHSLRSGNSPAPSTPGMSGHQSPLSFLAPGMMAAGAAGTRRMSAQEVSAYYRQPRERRQPLPTAAERRASMMSSTPAASAAAVALASPRGRNRDLEGIASKRVSAIDSILPVNQGGEMDVESEMDLDDWRTRTQRTEYYARREGDLFYGVRGPALSSSIVRKRTTGPADPNSTAGAVGSWLRGAWSAVAGGGAGRNAGNDSVKGKAKGFEVVRSRPAAWLDEDEVATGGGMMGLGMRALPREVEQDGPPVLRDIEMSPAFPMDVSGDAANKRRSYGWKKEAVPTSATSSQPSYSYVPSYNAHPDLQRELSSDKNLQQPAYGFSSGSMSSTNSAYFPAQDQDFERSNDYDYEPYHYQHKYTDQPEIQQMTAGPSSSEPQPAPGSGKLSTGKVQTHVTGDSIKRYTLKASHMGETAQVFGGDSR